jgi:hypothetical protein
MQNMRKRTKPKPKRPVYDHNVEPREERPPLIQNHEYTYGGWVDTRYTVLMGDVQELADGALHPANPAVLTMVRITQRCWPGTAQSGVWIWIPELGQWQEYRHGWQERALDALEKSRE